MAENIEPLDDDLLDTVTGGNGLNSSDQQCENGWQWKPGTDSTRHVCSTCLKNGTPMCNSSIIYQ